MNDSPIIKTKSRYKMGHTLMTCNVAIIARNIIRIEEVPMEVPDYQDGCLSRIQLSTGESLYSIELHDVLIERWEAAVRVTI